MTETTLYCSNRWHPQDLIPTSYFSLTQTLQLSREAVLYAMVQHFRLFPSCDTFSPTHYFKIFHNMGESPGGSHTAIKCHICHCPEQFSKCKGDDKDRHSVSKKNKKTITPPYQLHAQYWTHQSLKKQTWLSPLHKLQYKGRSTVDTWKTNAEIIQKAISALKETGYSQETGWWITKAERWIFPLRWHSRWDCLDEKEPSMQRAGRRVLQEQAFLHIIIPNTKCLLCARSCSMYSKHKNIFNPILQMRKEKER